MKINATAYTRINGYMAVSYDSVWYKNNSTYSLWRITQGANVWHYNGKIDMINKNFETYTLSNGTTAYTDLVVESGYFDEGPFQGVAGVYVKTCTDRTRRSCRSEILINDDIVWNEWRNRYYSDGEIKHLIAHEFGHSLGLGENPYNGNVMYQYKMDLATTYFGRDDRDSYRARHGQDSFWG